MPLVASLPNSANSMQRQAYLDRMRRIYAYHYSYNDTFATIIKLPQQEQADCAYRYASLKNLLKIIPHLPTIMLAKLKYATGIPVKSFDEYLFFGRSSFTDTRLLTNFLSDEYFGLQRAIGINHVLLHRVKDSPPANLDLNRIKQQFTQLISDTSYDEALQQQRLYYVDYAMLQGLVDNPGSYKGRKQYVTAPIVLLYRLANGNLQPIAIQLNQVHSDTNPVFMPLDGSAWTAAKLYAQIADVNYQELITHATRIHYLVEGFVIATHRELYKTHPLFLLLKHHLRYTLSVNVHHLFLKNAKGVPGDFGAQLAGDYDAMVDLMAKAFKTYDFASAALPLDVATRGVDDEKLFYPYADEGRQIWDLIQKFVYSYLELYYSDAVSVQQDNEIQAWARLMASDSGMRIKGFPSHFTDLNQLSLAVAQIIFITSAHHASIHYPQYLFSGFNPSMPFAAYAPAPTAVDKSYTQQDLLQILPLLQPALTQTFIFYLTDFKLGKLGEYSQLEAKSQPVVRAYQAKLAELSVRLQHDLIHRNYPYNYLEPSRIPNSVMV